MNNENDNYSPTEWAFVLYMGFGRWSQLLWIYVSVLSTLDFIIDQSSLFFILLKKKKLYYFHISVIGIGISETLPV